MKPFETRAGLPVESIDIAADNLRVAGYAAVFGEAADIGGYFRERIAPGAFAAAVGRDDVVFLVNHEGLPLARTRSGTLTLREDARGLHMQTDLDPTDPDVAAIVPKMRRGDLDKMSFAFTVAREEWDETGDVPLRTILEVKQLFDVSIVTTPAYDGTEIGLRGLRDHQARQRRINFDACRRRLRMKTNLAGLR